MAAVIPPIPPVPRVPQAGTGIFAWQRWFFSLHQSVSALISANSNIGVFASQTGTTTNLASGTIAALCALSLPAGDWDIQGSVEFEPGPNCRYSDLILGISQSATAFGASPGTRTRRREQTNTIGVAQTIQELSTPMVQMTLAATTTVYLLAEVTFSTDVMAAIGYIRARSY